MFSTQWHRCPHCPKINAGQAGPDTKCRKCTHPTLCLCPACGHRLFDHQAICGSCQQSLSWNGNHPVAASLGFFGLEGSSTSHTRQLGSYEIDASYLAPSVIRRIVQQHNNAVNKAPNQQLARRAAIVLRKIKTLSLEIAEELQQALGVIHLPDLIRLNIDAARCLASHVGRLYLDGMSSLGADLALALSKHPGRLSFGNLETISSETAAALTNHTGVLALHRLKEISPESAAALCEHHGLIELDSLEEHNTPAILRARLYTNELREFTASITHLDEYFAEKLSYKNGSHELLLDGLRDLTAAVAKKLAASEAKTLSLNGLQTVPPNVALELGQFRGALRLDGVTHVDSSAMHSLSQSPHQISMRSLMKLPTEWFSTSGKRSWDLNLYGITAMPPAAAHRLTDFPGTIRFDRGNWLSKSLFEILKNARGRLVIEDPQSVPQQLQQAIKTAGGAFEFAATETELQRLLKRIEKRSQHPDAATQRLVLKNTTSVTVKEAHLLAQWPGVIEFSRGIDLDRDIALALATHRGTLICRMLSSLDEPILYLAIQHQGQQMLFGDYAITDEHIEILLQKQTGTVMPDPGAIVSLRDEQKRRLQENPRIRIDA